MDIAASDIESFTCDFDNPESAVAQAYQKGADKADYAIDVKLYELAKKGDLDALEQYDKRKQQQRLREKDAKRNR